MAKWIHNEFYSTFRAKIKGVTITATVVDRDGDFASYEVMEDGVLIGLGTIYPEDNPFYTSSMVDEQWAVCEALRAANKLITQNKQLIPT